MKKRIILNLLATMMVLAFCGCGTPNNVSTDSSAKSQANSSETTLDKIDSIKSGQSREDVIKILGEPVESKNIDMVNSQEVLQDYYEFTDVENAYLLIYSDSVLEEKREVEKHSN